MEINPWRIEAETMQTLKNIESVLQKINLTKEDIFKCTCMLVDIKDWPKMSKVYKSFFNRKNLPARTFAGSGLRMLKLKSNVWQKPTKHKVCIFYILLRLK